MRIGLSLPLLWACVTTTNAFQHRSPVSLPNVKQSSELYEARRRTERYYPSDYSSNDNDYRSRMNNVDGYDRSYENLGDYRSNGQGPQRRYQEYRSDGQRPMNSGQLSYRGRPQNFNNREFMDAEFIRSSNGSRHLWIVISATCWWYLLTSFNLVANPPTGFFLGMDKGSFQAWGGAIAMMTLPMYASCTKILKARTLREAQVGVLGVAAVAAPTSALISVVNPTNSYGWTAVAFAEVTMFLGVFLAHHVRLASFRDPRGPPNYNPQTPFDALNVYTPPRFYQSTLVAWDLTRSMVAFHVSMCVIGQTLIANKQTFAALFPFNSQLWPWVLVALHMGHECMITALYPGSKLRRYLNYALADSALYTLQIYAALSSPIVQKWLSGGGGGSHALLANQVLVVAFVTNAALQLLEPMSAIIRAFDMDQRFGLTNYYNSGGYMQDYDRRYESYYGNPDSGSQGFGNGNQGYGKRSEYANPFNVPDDQRFDQRY